MKEEEQVIFYVIFSGCLLFDAGLISRTCEDYFTCEESPQNFNPIQDTTEIPDTSAGEPSDENIIEYEFHPNEFTFYVEQSIFEQKIVNHSSWQNQIKIVLFERDDMEGYPKLDMESCLLFLNFDDVEENEPNAQSFFGYNIESFEISHDTSLKSQCSEMNPNLLEAYKRAAENAQWSVGIGDITNSIYIEYDSWVTQNEHELLEIEKDGNYSNVHHFISTIYVRSDWSGSLVTLAPGVTLAYQSNVGGTINENVLHVLQSITEPPDGFYFSRMLFPYSLFDVDIEFESEILEE